MRPGLRRHDRRGTLKRAPRLAASEAGRLLKTGHKSFRFIFGWASVLMALGIGALMGALRGVSGADFGQGSGR